MVQVWLPLYRIFWEVQCSECGGLWHLFNLQLSGGVEAPVSCGLSPWPPHDCFRLGGAVPKEAASHPSLSCLWCEGRENGLEEDEVGERGGQRRPAGHPAWQCRAGGRAASLAVQTGLPRWQGRWCHGLTCRRPVAAPCLTPLRARTCALAACVAVRAAGHAVTGRSWSPGAHPSVSRSVGLDRGVVAGVLACSLPHGGVPSWKVLCARLLTRLLTPP